MNKGEIWLAEFPSQASREQAGTRPAVILADTEANIAIVVPLTSNIQALRFPHTIEVEPSKLNGLSAISIALCFHLRAVDKSRLKKKIGDIEKSLLAKIDEMIKALLGLQNK